MWCASQVVPYPTISPYIVAPLLTACSYSSSTSAAAPSPIMKPLLLSSKGQQAEFISSFWLKAIILAKPAIPIGLIAASAPPASIASA